MMVFRRWAIRYRIIAEGKVIVDKQSRIRCFTKRGAEHEAKRLESDPGVILRMMDAVERGFTMYVDCKAVRYEPK